MTREKNVDNMDKRFYLLTSLYIPFWISNSGKGKTFPWTDRQIRLGVYLTDL